MASPTFFESLRAALQSDGQAVPQTSPGVRRRFLTRSGDVAWVP